MSALLLLLEDISRQVSPHPFAVCAAVALALAAAADYGSCAFTWSVLGSANTERQGGAWRWLVGPLCVVILVTAQLTRWPLHLRFAASKPALVRAMAQLGTEERWTGTRWIGWFPVSQAYRYEHAVYFIVGNSLADPVAICYDPSQPAPHWLRYQIDGEWYAVED